MKREEASSLKTTLTEEEEEGKEGEEGRREVKRGEENVQAKKQVPGKLL